MQIQILALAAVGILVFAGSAYYLDVSDNLYYDENVSPSVSDTATVYTRVAQSIVPYYNKINSVSFYFAGCQGQQIRLTTEQTYGNTYPSDNPPGFYDDMVFRLPSSGSDETVTITGFNYNYEIGFEYWFQLWLIEGDSFDVYLAEVEYSDGFAVLHENPSWHELESDLGLNIEWVGDMPDDVPGELVEFSFSSRVGDDVDVRGVKSTTSEGIKVIDYDLGDTYTVYRVEGLVDTGYSGQTTLQFLMGDGPHRSGGYHYLFSFQIDGLRVNYPDGFDLWVPDSYPVGRHTGSYLILRSMAGFDAWGTFYCKEV